MARKSKEDMEETKRRILQSALDLFCERGYAKTSFDAIAKNINLTKGAVYWHFKNKQDIIITLLEENVLKHIARKIEEPSSLDELSEYFYNTAAAIQKDENQRKFMFFMHFQMEWSEDVFKYVSPKLREICEVPLNNLKNTFKKLKENNLLAKDVDPDIAGETIYCLWYGLLAKFVADENRFDFADLSKKTISLALRGFSK